MEEKGYNGWTNYETWVVALWIDNDEGNYNYRQELAGEVLADESEYPVADLMDKLSEWVGEWPDIAAAQDGGSLAADLVGAALSEVNWHEIATNYIDEEKEALNV